MYWGRKNVSTLAFCLPTDFPAKRDRQGKTDVKPSHQCRLQGEKTRVKLPPFWVIYAFVTLSADLSESLGFLRFDSI
jgi:hypothetical protein